MNTEKAWAVSVQGDAYYDASAVTNELFKGLFYGGFIDAPVKDKVLDNSSTENRLGAEAGWNLDVYHLAGLNVGGSTIPWKLSISERVYANSSYSKDFYELLFYGNKPFEGTTVSAGPLSVNAYRLQQFGISALFSEKKHEAGLSLVNGHSGIFGNVDAFDLATATQGLNLDLNASGSLTTMTSSSYVGSNGLGFAVNFRVNDILEFDDSFKLSLTASNLGLVWWNSTDHRSLDTNISFSGIAIDDLFAFSADSISVNDSILSNSRDTSFSMVLPADLRLMMTSKVTDQITLTYGVQYLLNANYAPRFLLAGSYQLSEILGAGLLLSYGGYGNFRIGIEADALLQDNLYAKATLQNVPGLISNNTSGMAAAIQLVKLF